MITSEQLKDKFKKDKQSQISTFKSELFNLYSLRSTIESTVSAMLLENAQPNLKGITFYDTVFGEKYLEFKKTLTVLRLDEMADHICNWFYLNGYYTMFTIEDNQIHFLVKWNYDPKKEK